MAFTFMHKKDNTISISARVSTISKRGKAISTLRTIGSFSPSKTWEEMPQDIKIEAEAVDEAIWKAIYEKRKDIIEAGLKRSGKEVVKTVDAIIENPMLLKTISPEKLEQLKKIWEKEAKETNKK